MVVHIVFTKVKTLDQSELDKYNQEVGASIAGHPIKLLSIYHKFQILEGTNENEGSVIAAFPSVETALAWYNSPLYQAAKVHRNKGAVYNVVLLEDK